MFTGMDVLVEAERRRDLLDRAAQDCQVDRLVRQNRPARMEGRRWLGQLGGWLIALGTHLRALHVAEVR